MENTDAERAAGIVNSMARKLLGLQATYEDHLKTIKDLEFLLECINKLKNETKSTGTTNE